MTPTRLPRAKPKANKESLPAVTWTDELRRVLAEIYSRGGLSEAAKAFRELRPDWPTECLIDYIVEEANRLSLVPQGTTGKALSDDEKEFILNHVSTASLGWIAEKLHRPETAIRQVVLLRHHARLYAVPFDGWSRELDEVLVEFCKRGRDGQRQAMLAIRATHPQISSNTIWARIVYLGLTTSKRPPYPRHEWSAEDLELLRSGYSRGRNGASRTINVLLERHPDWSRSVISRKAKSLGLSRKREGRYRPWGEEADRKLISGEGFEMEGIEKRMKRSIASIRSRLAVLDRGAEFFGGFKTKDLMEMLNLDQSAIRRLERRRLLKRKRGRITEDSLKFLCREHPEEIPFDTLDEKTKRRLVADYNYAKPKRARQGEERRSSYLGIQPRT